MEDWTILLISLSALCGLILLASVIVTARVSYRRARRTKRGKLVYGSVGRREDLDGGQDSDNDATAAAAAVAGGPEAKGWFAAQPGPNGSAQYLDGWFALDSSSTQAGEVDQDLLSCPLADEGYDDGARLRKASRPPSYTSADASATEPSVPSPSLSEPMRESHFSRAQRAARRANKLFKRVPQRQEAVEEKQPGEGEGEGGGKVVEKGKGTAKGKKKPRVSRTTEAANAELGAGAEAAAEESHVCDQQTDQ